MRYLLILLVFTACTHRSEPKSEMGVIVEKQYFPDTNQIVSGTGFTSNGKMVFTSHHIGDDEKYIVIFKCDHGVVFSINRPDLYGNLNKGDKVRIEYYEILNRDNELKDLEFINAEKL